jgi:hypothetical protein
MSLVFARCRGVAGRRLRDRCLSRTLASNRIMRKRIRGTGIRAPLQQIARRFLRLPMLPRRRSTKTRRAGGVE